MPGEDDLFKGCSKEEFCREFDRIRTEDGYLSYLAEPLVWSCPGRRSPTPEPEDDDDDEDYEDCTDDDDDDHEGHQSGQGSLAAAVPGPTRGGRGGGGSGLVGSTTGAANDSMDFEFDNDDGEAVTPAAARGSSSANKELRGSARKKTASFNNVVEKLTARVQGAAAAVAASSAKGSGPGSSAPPSNLGPGSGGQQS